MKIFDKSLEIAFAQFPEWGDARRTFHVSFLFERTRLICMAQNIPKTSPRNIHNNVKNFDLAIKQRCAELNLFIKAKNKFDSIDWRRIILVNVRIAKNGEVKNSRPCVSCENLCVGYLGVRNIYYTTDEGIFEKY